jgi:dATP pyrophosphohydrolase
VDVPGPAEPQESEPAPEEVSGAVEPAAPDTDRRADTGYKRPESVLVVVYTAGGEVLLLRRTEPADFWQSVTGSLRRDESPRRAALRELREETGLAISPSALLDWHHAERFPILPAWRARYAPGVHYNLEHWFAVRLPGRRLVRTNADEHREYRWLPIGRAAAMATSWTNRNAILALGGLASLGIL